MALAYGRADRIRAAEAVYRRALTIQETALGPAHPDLLETLDGYTVTLRRLDRDAEAIDTEERATRIRATIATGSDGDQRR